MHGGRKPPGRVATGDENLRPSRKPCQWLRSGIFYADPAVEVSVSQFTTCLITRVILNLYLLRLGRLNSSPPQFGQTFFISAAHFSQKVHSIKSRSSLCHLPVTLGGIFRTPASFAAPYNSLTNMDVHQVRAAEFRHVSHLLTRNRQEAC